MKMKYEYNKIYFDKTIKSSLDMVNNISLVEII